MDIVQILVDWVSPLTIATAMIYVSITKIREKIRTDQPRRLVNLLWIPVLILGGIYSVQWATNFSWEFNVFHTELIWLFLMVIMSSFLLLALCMKWGEERILNQRVVGLVYGLGWVWQWIVILVGEMVGIRAVSPKNTAYTPEGVLVNADINFHDPVVYLIYPTLIACLFLVIMIFAQTIRKAEPGSPFRRNLTLFFIGFLIGTIGALATSLIAQLIEVRVMEGVSAITLTIGWVIVAITLKRQI